MSKIIDLQNKDFGYWHVIEQAESRQGRAYWKCQYSNFLLTPENEEQYYIENT